MDNDELRERLEKAEAKIERLLNMQVELVDPGAANGGKSPIRDSDTNALLPIPRDPRVDAILSALNKGTITAVCNEDTTITVTLTLPGLPSG